MNEVLAVLDKDKEYLEQLIHYLKQKKNFNFIVVAFTDITAYLEYEETNKVAILLYHNSYDEFVFGCNAKQKIVLMETKAISEENKVGIYKYQSVEILMKEILRLYEGTQVINIREALSGDLHIVGIASIIGEVSSNYVGAILAYEYGKSKRTLFLSLDPFQSKKMLGLREEFEGVSDLIYYVKQKNNNLSLKMASLINKIETFDYIIGLSHWNDLFELQEEEVKQILNTIRSHLNYEVLVVEMGSINHISIALMEECNYIYQPMQKGEIYREKDKEFRRQVILKKDELFANKIKPVLVPEVDYNVTTNVIFKSEKMNEFARELVTKEGSCVG